MFRRLSRHAWLTPLLIAAMSLVISATLSGWAPLPLPQFHDEFSYLLAGETFARGRLTNPAHPLWRFFETYGVLSQPTYMSKYPPVQGMFLGLGRAIADAPIVGVWISTALACAAAWWALAGLVPRRWATIGAAIVALHPLMLQWNWSYWGGAGSMIGGCLLVGALARVRKKSSLFSGAMLGLCVGILMNSRPFEGAVLTMACVMGMLYRSHGRKSVVRSPRTGVRGCDAFIAAVVVFGAILLWTGYYNHRVTGRVTQFPYMLYEKQYAVTPPLFWLSPPKQQPTYTHAQMRRFYEEWEWQLHERHRTIAGLMSTLKEKLLTLLKGYFGSPVLVVPFLMAVVALRHDPLLRRMSLVALAGLAAAFSAIGFFPHYTGPIAVVLLYIVVQGMRHLRAVLPRILPAVIVFLLLHAIAAGVTCWRLSHASAEGWQSTRAQFQSELSREGKHLVIVRSENAYAHFDWVYNEPDIDASPVVWARDMGADENRRLMDYCRDRTVWLLSVDEAAARLDPYPR